MAPRRPRRSDQLRRFLLTPRERRDLDARFRRDMRELRRVSGISRSPATATPNLHPKESLDHFGARVLDTLEELLLRYTAVFSGIRRGRSGRPRKIQSSAQIS